MMMVTCLDNQRSFERFPLSEFHGWYSSVGVKKKPPATAVVNLANDIRGMIFITTISSLYLTEVDTYVGHRAPNQDKRQKKIIKPPTNPPPVNERKGSLSMYSPHVAPSGTPYGMASTSFAPYEIPLPRSHFKLPVHVPSTPLQRQNPMDSNITLLIQNQLSTAFKDFSLANNANLQQQQQLHRLAKSNSSPSRSAGYKPSICSLHI
ncbi:hypothetical protein K3495_g7918 [Podosphaera aphanis]|nr:hypothetical protein K3495_g7918 [Podosphaera aphanis]